MNRLSLALGLASALAFASLGHAQTLKGEVKADGSSTVYLITEAAAAQFKKLHPDVNITIGIAGTGGGFRKFANGETDIQDASRKIKEGEAADCRKNGIDYIELQIAWDGLALILHKENQFASKLTMEQLKKVWHPDTESFKNAKTWNDVDPSFPKEPLSLWGAGKDSGTFDYFTEAVNGKEKVIRQDYNPSEDDNTTVTGVSKNKNAMGFLGVAYYEQNKNKLNVAAIAKKAGDEHYLPTNDNVLAQRYPITRPLYIYVRTKSLERPEVREFVDFYLRQGRELAKKAGYVELNTVQAFRERNKFIVATKK